MDNDESDITLEFSSNFLSERVLSCSELGIYSLGTESSLYVLVPLLAESLSTDKKVRFRIDSFKHNDGIIKTIWCKTYVIILTTKYTIEYLRYGDGAKKFEDFEIKNKSDVELNNIVDICCIDAVQHFGILHENGIVSEWRLKGKEFCFEKSNRVPYTGSLLCCDSDFFVASSDGRVCQVGGCEIYDKQDSIPVQQIISDNSNGYWISKQLIVARCHEQTIVEQALIPTAFPPLSLFLNGSKLGCVTRNARVLFYENGDWSERVLKGNAVSGEWQCRGVHVSSLKAVLALALTPARTYCHLSNRTPFVVRILALEKPTSLSFGPDILLYMKMTANKLDHNEDARIKRFYDIFTSLQKGQHVGDWQHFDKNLQVDRIMEKATNGSVVRAHRRFLRKFFPKALPNTVDLEEEECLPCRSTTSGGQNVRTDTDFTDAKIRYFLSRLPFSGAVYARRCTTGILLNASTATSNF
ncbi:DgyrCDS450 [Dimorphilus gyrociliatus]|uniref:DgyrCDS450 n=1 Tax=Dimorphilus gyrociliatus TaxID=2664684 RepID=A0A7I8V4P1_9ANNE|nr:DgyrCDS450 [Dimorphilus gyrociliatus]